MTNTTLTEEDATGEGLTNNPNQRVLKVVTTAADGYAYQSLDVSDEELLDAGFVRSGIHLSKYWFSVTQGEQKRRFASRETDPLKRWKLSPIDRASLDKWDDYTEAKEAMFFYTDTADAPWTVVKSDDKKRARLNCVRHFLSQFDYPDKDEVIAQPPDPKIVGQASHVIHGADHILASSLHPATRKT